ncbi:MAG: arginine repressor [Actinobacteria bacterium]|nr:arginine repressor [Actinomycetota bacterium]
MKEQRQKAIKSIIENKGVKTQQDLLEELKKIGIETTQATLSRDLEELGFDKIKNQGGYILSKEDIPVDKLNHLEQMLKNFVRSVNESENVIVIKTSAGNAQGVALAIDEVGLSEIIGTVAGDDTIITIVASGISAKKVVKKFRKMMEQNVGVE